MGENITVNFSLLYTLLQKTHIWIVKQPFAFISTAFSLLRTLILTPKGSGPGKYSVTLLPNFPSNHSCPPTTKWELLGQACYTCFFLPFLWFGSQSPSANHAKSLLTGHCHMSSFKLPTQTIDGLCFRLYILGVQAQM